MGPIFSSLLVASYAWAVWYNLTRNGNPRGAGVGKRAMGIAVIQLSGEPCTRGKSAGRQAIMALTGILPFVGWLIEPIAMLASKDGRRLGDRAAGTRVVEAEAWARSRQM